MGWPLPLEKGGKWQNSRYRVGLSPQFTSANASRFESVWRARPKRGLATIRGVHSNEIREDPGRSGICVARSGSRMDGESAILEVEERNPPSKTWVPVRHGEWLLGRATACAVVARRGQAKLGGRHG